jgi:5-methylthioadenosine/S-adenosylhomocysteine deaminase
VLKMATRNGAAALGHDSGELSPGKKADVILIDLNSSMFTPLQPGNTKHLFSHLVFAANGGCVNSVIIDGEIVMRERVLTMVDEAKVLSEANAAFLRVADDLDVQLIDSVR